MAWDMRKHELLDPFNGQADLNTGFIRCVGKPEARFQEDYSRILRAMRFACRFDFQIEEQTWSALTKIMTKINNIRDVKVVDVIRRKIALCKKPAEKEKLQAHLAEQTMSDPNQTMAEYIVPRETAAKELLKTLKENPARALELWDESGALKAFLPETLKMKGCEQPAQFHSEGDVWKHTMMMLQKINSKEFREYFKGAHITGEFVLGVLLHDAGKPPTKKTPEADGTNRIRFDGHDQVSATIAGEVANRLSLSKEQKELLKFMTSEHMVPMSAKDMFQMSANKFARRFIDSPYSTELLMLFYLDSVCSVRADGADTLQNFRDTLKRIEEINQNRAKWSKEKRKKITNGDTVIKTLQIKSGCFVGCVLELLAELADSGRLASEEEAIRFLEMNKGAIVDFEKNAKPENRGEIAEKMIKQFDQN
ncbi:hypothetical protein A2482_01390 [Candidatus Falkowbacteria bacterium RIFOXYC2_FULL_48_21]|uniref:HD domain-containing protein n=1 Tax=Candidatus Falkowbacteria bacterium RIFOXYC2_FULL_48_21 TaxID=1798005 RepID=A0A1F5TGV1_9BACT|nr:MAG: hypothetical protein A2482_01390 [Candidatus Falkowbacteria bacterium RIFOXYC2_FULL_48_21]